MINSGKGIRGAVAGALCAGLLIVAGCTKYASPDDLKRLDEANKAAVAAEKDLESAKAERRALETQIAAKQAELDSAKAELEAIKRQ